MSFNRRSILGGLVAAPVAAKQVAEKVALSIAEMEGAAKIPGMSGISHPPSDTWGPKDSVGLASAGPRVPFVEQARRFLRSKQNMDEFTSILYAENKIVSHLDPDLMYSKALSPAAKITYQRQRNVERAMREAQTDTIRPFEWLHRKMSGL